MTGAVSAPPNAAVHVQWRSEPGSEPAARILANAALPELLREALTIDGSIAVGELELVAVTAGGADAVVSLHLCLSELISAGFLTLTTGGPQPDAVLEPMTARFHFRFGVDLPDTLQLSRFAYLRAEGGRLLLESPLSMARVRLGPAAGEVVAALAAGRASAELLGADPTPQRRGLLELLVGAGFAGETTDDGCALDASDTLRQWDFADLAFHARSRLGRHDYPMGGTFRFAGILPPPPVLPERPWPTSVFLPPPGGPLPLDNGLGAVLDRRRSVREQSSVPITVRELGDFLFHAARVRGFVPGPYGPLSSRPYPTGGASYELELYLTVDRCADLPPGFYYYDAARHGLAFVRRPDADTRQMLLNACTSSGGSCYPQVLISVASRFQRIAWKYTGIAYATTLKNVGALYATFYLVGTAMGLAPCALGLGDSELFSRVAGTDPLEESVVGEFMLGAKALGVQR